MTSSFNTDISIRATKYWKLDGMPDSFLDNRSRRVIEICLIIKEDLCQPGNLRRPITAPQIKQELDTRYGRTLSAQTIRRYVRSLIDGGFPIASIQGRGYCLALPPTSNE